MGTSASQAGLEVNDETESGPIPAKGGVDTLATESTSKEAMKASDVRFFWVEGGGADEDGSYHWCVDCPSLLMSIWYGGRLVSSVAPPPGAADTADAREILETHLLGSAWDPGVVAFPVDGAEQERGLCGLCRLHYPRAVASPCPPIGSSARSAGATESCTCAVARRTTEAAA